MHRRPGAAHRPGDLPLRHPGSMSRASDTLKVRTVFGEVNDASIDLSRSPVQGIFELIVIEPSHY
jgi:hypothetical protein